MKHTTDNNYDCEYYCNQPCERWCFPHFLRGALSSSVHIGNCKIFNKKCTTQKRESSTNRKRRKKAAPPQKRMGCKKSTTRKEEGKRSTTRKRENDSTTRKRTQPTLTLSGTASPSLFCVVALSPSRFWVLRSSYSLCSWVVLLSSPFGLAVFSSLPLWVGPGVLPSPPWRWC